MLKIYQNTYYKYNLLTQYSKFLVDPYVLRFSNVDASPHYFDHNFFTGDVNLEGRVLLHVSLFGVHEVIHIRGQNQVVSIIKRPFYVDVVLWIWVWPSNSLETINKEGLGSLLSDIVLDQKVLVNLGVFQSFLGNHLLSFKFSTNKLNSRFYNVS